MENEKIKNGIKEIQNIRMTKNEKENTLKIILNSPTPIKPIKSPYSFLSIFPKRYFINYAVAFCLIIVLSGGGIVSASQKSVPGNALYALKVNIIEPINSSLKFSAESKAQYETSLAIERLVEAETLAYQGKLDMPKEKQLNDLLIVHTEAFDKAINKLSKEEQKEKAQIIAKNFQYEMNSHAEALDIITQKSDYENKEKNIRIAKTARNNAEKINASSEENGISTGKIIGYEKEKNPIESSTSKIASKNTNKDNTSTLSTPISAGQPTATINSTTSIQPEITTGLKKAFDLYKNGQISECSENGEKYYSASLNMYDGEGKTFDENGKVVGEYQGFTGAYTGIALQNCERVYVVYPNIWGYPWINKYNLK